jgi:hypothetical protein
MKNWKTTLFGSGGIAFCLFDIISNIIIGTPEKVQWAIDIPAIIGGVGLIFAKDSNVTGGTVSQ